MDSSWRDLLILLRGSSSRAEIVAEVVVDTVSITDLPNLFHETIINYLSSYDSDTRVNASKLLFTVSKKFKKYLMPLLVDSQSDGNLVALKDINISKLLDANRNVGLYSGETVSLEGVTNGQLYDKNWLLKQKLHFQKLLGISTSSADARTAFSVAESTVTLLEEDIKVENPIQLSAEINLVVVTDSRDLTTETWLARLLRYLVIGLLHNKWEVRHGCCVGITSILKGLISTENKCDSQQLLTENESIATGTYTRQLPSFLANDIVCCTVVVLLLDRFMDLSCSEISPVKDGAATLLCEMVADNLNPDEINMVWGLLFEMVTVAFGYDWNVQLGGMLTISKLLTCTQLSDQLSQRVLDSILENLSSKSDDVRTITAVAASNFFLSTLHDSRSSFYAVRSALSANVSTSLFTQLSIALGMINEHSNSYIKLVHVISVYSTIVIDRLQEVELDILPCVNSIFELLCGAIDKMYLFSVKLQIVVMRNLCKTLANISTQILSTSSSTLFTFCVKAMNMFYCLFTQCLCTAGTSDGTLSLLSKKEYESSSIEQCDDKDKSNLLNLTQQCTSLLTLFMTPSEKNALESGAGIPTFLKNMLQYNFMSSIGSSAQSILEPIIPLQDIHTDMNRLERNIKLILEHRNLVKESTGHRLYYLLASSDTTTRYRASSMITNCMIKTDSDELLRFCSTLCSDCERILNFLWIHECIGDTKVPTNRKREAPLSTVSSVSKKRKVLVDKGMISVVNRTNKASATPTMKDDSKPTQKKKALKFIITKDEKMNEMTAKEFPFEKRGNKSSYKDLALSCTPLKEVSLSNFEQEDNKEILMLLEMYMFTLMQMIAYASLLIKPEVNTDMTEERSNHTRRLLSVVTDKFTILLSILNKEQSLPWDDSGKQSVQPQLAKQTTSNFRLLSKFAKLFCGDSVSHMEVIHFYCCEKLPSVYDYLFADYILLHVKKTRTILPEHIGKITAGAKDTALAGLFDALIAKFCSASSHCVQTIKSIFVRISQVHGIDLIATQCVVKRSRDINLFLITESLLLSPDTKIVSVAWELAKLLSACASTFTTDFVDQYIIEDKLVYKLVAILLSSSVGTTRQKDQKLVDKVEISDNAIVEDLFTSIKSFLVCAKHEDMPINMDSADSDRVRESVLHQLFHATKLQIDQGHNDCRQLASCLLYYVCEFVDKEVVAIFEPLFSFSLRLMNDFDKFVRKNGTKLVRLLVPLVPLVKEMRRNFKAAKTNEVDPESTAMQTTLQILDRTPAKRLIDDKYSAQIIASLTRMTNLVCVHEGQVDIGVESNGNSEILRDRSGLCRDSLRGYQWDGVTWLTYLRRSGFCGILADEMGLGKTVQAITALAVLRLEKAFKTCNSLVICPASLVIHWQHEIMKFVPENILNPQIYISNSTNQSSSTGNVGDVVYIVSYHMLRKDINFFKNIIWESIILDEGHLIKNPKSLIARSVFSLKSRFRMILTGTPVQNRIEELWSLMNFLIPDYLGDYQTFTKTVVNPIRKALAERTAIKLEERKLFTMYDQSNESDHTANSMENTAENSRGSNKSILNKFEKTVEFSANGLQLLRSVHKQVLPFILRRTKEVVASELPKKTIVDIYCPLSQQQKSMYSRYQQGLSISDETLESKLKQYRNMNGNLSIDLPSISSDRATNDSDDDEFNFSAVYNKIATEKKKYHPLQAFTYLKLVCVHPSLAIASTHNNYKRKLMEQPFSSGKLAKLTQLLIDSGVADLDEFHGDCSNTYDTFLASLHELEELSTLSTSRNVTSTFPDDEDSTCGDIADDSSDDASIDIVKESSASDSFSGNTKNLKNPIHHRCLIFCQHKLTLDLIEELVLRKYFPTIDYERLDGDTPPTKRGLIAEEFNSQAYAGSISSGTTDVDAINRLKHSLPSVANSRRSNVKFDRNIRILLLTTRACGLGLNLTAADTVIFVEHDWNPFIDLQAMDRVHRIGQKNPVTIYRLLADSSIEARIVNLQDQKQSVVNQIINEANSIDVQNVGLGGVLWNSLNTNSNIASSDSFQSHQDDLNLDQFLKSIGENQ